MRGVRGAAAAWFSGDKPLPLDYQLISRQQELGSLGAYLSPLRAARLVIPGTLKPSPLATDILDAFWDEPSPKSHALRYDNYAMEALDLRRTHIERRWNALKLSTIGERSRLSSLVGRPRPEQQKRLHEVLVEAVPDRGTTSVISKLVEGAAQANIYSSREIIDGALAGRWVELPSTLFDMLRTARAFGDLMDLMLRFFDRAYVALDR